MVNVIGEKVLLTPFTETDLTDDYVSWLNDPQVTRFSNQRFIKHDHASCERYLASFAGTPNHFLSVRRLADGRRIGTMTAYVAPHHGTADIGIMIGDRSAWGAGHGFDSWTALMRWLFETQGLRKITAGTLAVNGPMIGIAERSGMVLEGRRLRQEIVDGDEVDILYYGRFAPR